MSYVGKYGKLKIKLKTAFFQRRVIALVCCLSALTLNAQSVFASTSPTFTPGPGVFFPGPTVLLTGPVGSNVYFTLDGTQPTTSSQLFDSGFPIVLGATTVIKAISVLDGSTSPVASAKYIVKSSFPLLTLPPAPLLSPYVSYMGSPVQIAVSTRAGYDCYYSNNNTIPPSSSTFLYSGPISTWYDYTLSAVSIKNGLSSTATSASVGPNSSIYPNPDPEDLSPLAINVQSPTN